MIKIAFVGAGGTVKTTLIDGLREKYRGENDVAFVEEAARKYFEKNPVPEDERRNIEVQGAIQKWAEANEQKAVESGAKLVFCDRSVIDTVCYLIAGGQNEDAENLYQNVVDWVPSYNKIYILDPVGVPMENDAVRTENEEMRTKLHQAFIEFFEQKDIAYELLSGSVQERLAAVTEYVKANE